MPIKTPLIEANNVSFSYGESIALENITFNIEKGDYVGIVGPNGGGKTTLLKILLGLFKPQGGTIAIDGVPLPEFKKKYEIGYVPQRISQGDVSFPATVTEVVESGRIPKIGIVGGLKTADHKAIDKALGIAGIANLKDRLMNSLSGGQRQRVYVARALASEPQLLILDEPFVGVDATTQKDFYAFLKQLNEREGMTIMFVSHDIDVVVEEAKSILCLNRGLLCFGSPTMLHEANMIENLYGKKITHIHRSK